MTPVTVVSFGHLHGKPPAAHLTLVLRDQDEHQTVTVIDRDLHRPVITH